MKPIELPILFNSDEGRKLQELDIETNIDDCHENMIMFFNIVAITASVEDPKKYSTIWTAGTDFLCAIPYEKLKQKIADNL